MKQWFKGLAAALTLFSMANSARAVISAEAETLVKDNTSFAIDAYRKLSASSEGNLFFSPYSISAALSMTYAGAKGETATQMAKVLHFRLKPEEVHPAFSELRTALDAIQKEGDVTLGIANSIWPSANYPFLARYIELLKTNYGVSVTPLDYGQTEAARATINKWVATKTRDKIQDLIAPGILTSLTRLTLVNAIYFKGNWKSAFKPEATRPAPFTKENGEKIQSPMMFQVGQFQYQERDDLQILELPYKGNSLSMIIVLPKATKTLKSLEKQLSEEYLRQWRTYLDSQRVEIYLPKFQLNWGTTLLNPMLQELGMRDEFDPIRADFSGMDGEKHNLYISAVLHKAFIDVNEEGTEAAAATAAVSVTYSFPPVQIIFRADHPFLFFIQDNRTGSILFMGRVTNPI